MSDLPLGRQGNLVVRQLKGVSDTTHLLWFWCPGCEEAHAFFYPRWAFNADFAKPTCSPSLLLRAEKRCHLFLRDGKLQFCGDSHHALAGQTVPLPEPPEWL